MKITNIIWGEGRNPGLPAEMDLPADIRAAGGESASERYESLLRAIDRHLRNWYGKLPEAYDVRPSREETVQYCLDQGTAIGYEPGTGETTDAEASLAAKEGREARYVDPEAVRYWEDMDSRKAFAVLTGMDLLDYDEWCAVCDATGIGNMLWADAHEISTILYENYEQTPLESPAVAGLDKPGVPPEQLGTIRNAFAVPEMSAEDEARIYGIMEKYGEPVLRTGGTKAIGTEAERTGGEPAVELHAGGRAERMLASLDGTVTVDGREMKLGSLIAALSGEEKNMVEEALAFARYLDSGITEEYLEDALAERGLECHDDISGDLWDRMARDAALLVYDCDMEESEGYTVEEAACRRVADAFMEGKYDGIARDGIEKDSDGQEL